MKKEKTTKALIYSFIIIGFASCLAQKHHQDFKANATLPKNYVLYIDAKDSQDLRTVKIDSITKSGRVEIHFANGDICFGQYKNNKKDGRWEYFNQKKQLYKVEVYLMDFLSRIDYWENKN